jgi:biopolymer transport protein ExbD
LNFKRTIPADDEGIPMSSMADIIFLLIIFFMQTTVFSATSGIEIELPHTESSESIAPKNITIMIASNGDIYLDGKQAALEEVGRYVVSKRTRNTNKGVVLESDGDVKYQYIMDVLDELLIVGVTNVSLPTRNEEDQPSPEE